MLVQARFPVGIRRVPTAVVPARGLHTAAPPPVRLRRRLGCALRRRGVVNAAAKKGAERVAEPSSYAEDEDDADDDDADLDLVWGSEDDEEEGEGDEEIFNFETGWNLKALGVDEDDDDEDSVQVRLRIHPRATLIRSLGPLRMSFDEDLAPPYAHAVHRAGA